MFIFLHIPKAAGISINHNIVKNTRGQHLQLLYAPPYELSLNNSKTNEFTNLTQKKLDTYNHILGHINFGIHQHFSRPCEYISLLRDPISRISSAYRYYEFYKEMSLTEFLQSGFAEADNGMVRRISGIGQSTPIGSVTHADLETAISNIEAHFSLIGTVEQYNQFLFMLGKQYGWNVSPSIRENVTTSHPNHTALLSESEKSTILSHNALDTQLHHYVSAHFSGRFDALSAEVHAEYESFISTT